MKIRVGFGYDVHTFATARALWLGGVLLDHPMGLMGHSDADDLIHAICDALLGAANMRDIGYHFPDNDPAYKNADSKELLRKTTQLLRESGYTLGNIDATVVAEAPKINPYIPSMQQTMATILEVTPQQISIKATTSEKMGFVGRTEGMAAYATVLIEQTTF